MHRTGLVLRRNVTLLVLCSVAVTIGTAWGQRPMHPMYRSTMPPGAIGQQKVQAGAADGTYVQPVEIKGPDGALIAVGCDGQFQYTSTALRVGMQIGHAYRLKVTDIPRREGAEVYPTIELIDRLYPPPGLKERFPITIELGQDDLEQALAGHMVVRVVYLEDPDLALSVAETDKTEQRYFDVLPSEDPLAVADELGRPMAIVRMGSRVPATNGADDCFFCNGPPVTLLTEPVSSPVETAPVVGESISLELEGSEQ